ncbi:hypothetical protein K6V21_14225 [Bacteroides cellulosilyticus]|nr:hypothetical protein K6V21_14225 [Bacteroides cellulosilyticus]
MEKEEPDKASAFKIMLYYATGAALLVIPDWLPMKCNDKSTARHQENGRCHMAGNRSDSPSLEPVVTSKDFTEYYVSPFSNQNTADGFSKVHLAEYHNIAFLSRLFYRVERNRFFHNTRESFPHCMHPPR